MNKKIELKIGPEIGEVYQITHTKKGTFVGQLIDIVDSEGDEYDQLFLTFKYDVRVNTDQERLSPEPGKMDVRVSNLRPSLILKLERLEGEDWLREVEVKEEKTPKQRKSYPKKSKSYPKKKKSFFDKVLKR